MALDNLLKNLSTEQIKQILRDSGYICDDITNALFVQMAGKNGGQYRYVVTYEEGSGSIYVEFKNGKLIADF